MCILCRKAVALLSEGHPERKEFTQLEYHREGKQIAPDLINAKDAVFFRRKAMGLWDTYIECVDHNFEA